MSILKDCVIFWLDAFKAKLQTNRQAIEIF